ncbi:hypothetical protein XENOCAPTIV_016047 [Xenoophorus captivus]|uniref:NFATC2-interacting protein n=1 Tax=Xenoophorus captivus TaxID=1517983 RepID=A0ABV0RTD0_9TELE
MPRNRRTRQCRTQMSHPDDDDDDDDVIFMSPMYSSDSLREIPLKIRCRTDVHKVLVLPVRLIPSPPVRCFPAVFLFPLFQTPSSLVLMGTKRAGKLWNEAFPSMYSDFIPASESISAGLSNASALHQEVPLSSIFSQYLSKLPARAHRKVRFHFDGSKVTGCQTPAQLDLEDGDIIEVWT